VAVGHANLANKIVSLGTSFDVGPAFRSALLISCTFDASIEQMLLPLVAGGAVVVFSDAAREAPRHFWQRMAQEAVTFVSCVPSYLESVIGAAPRGAYLEDLALGGERFTSALHQEILYRLAVGRMTQLYGPTEATIDAVGFAVAAWRRCRLGSQASFTLRARGWRGAIWVVRGSPRSGLLRTRLGLRGAGCTAAGILRAGARRGCWSLWGVRMRR
jgi:acyl-CoA synthetase (AMP-forming)/AMP-acid ligase II